MVYHEDHLASINRPSTLDIKCVHSCSLANIQEIYMYRNSAYSLTEAGLGLRVLFDNLCWLFALFADPKYLQEAVDIFANPLV